MVGGIREVAISRKKERHDGAMTEIANINGEKK
jgi:hypothetical protein